MLLINVTEFFRDPPAWEHLRDEVLPGLLAAKDRGRADPRVERRLRERAGGLHGRDRARRAARHRRLPRAREDLRDRHRRGRARPGAPRPSTRAKEIESVPPELRERYFERADQRLAFRKDLRRTVIFGRNNLVQDAPISRLDLLICRNTLMYFNAETQARILRHFHFALRDSGVLMLGKSEMMISHRDLFGADRPQAADLRQAVARPRVAARASAFADGDAERARWSDDDALSRDAALELGPHAARDRLAHRPADVRQPAGPRAVPDLAARTSAGRSRSSRSPTSPSSCATPIEQALRERRRVAGRRGRASRPTRGDAAAARRHRRAAAGARQRRDRRQHRLRGRHAATPRCRRELEGNRRDLELAYEELQSTIDELETTNEELQSANEELQTTNEELQSTNEELETMNEELQSTNEELETINDELRERTGELNQVNDFLEAILTSLGLGVAVLDRAAARAGLEPPGRGPVGPAPGRGGRPPLPQPRHRPARPSSSRRRCARCSSGASDRESASSRRSTGAGARSSARRPSCRCRSGAGRRRRGCAARSC